MFAVIEIFHEAKTSYADFKIIGTYERREFARMEMKKKYHQTLKSTGCYRPESQSDCTSDEAWIVDEFCNHYDWYVAADDGRTWCYCFGGAYECGFDDEE